MTLVESSNERGRCHTVHIHRRMKPTDRCSLEFDLTDRRDLVVYLHGPGAEADLNWRQWPALPEASVLLEPGVEVGGCQGSKIATCSYIKKSGPNLATPRVYVGGGGGSLDQPDRDLLGWAFPVPR